MLRHYIRHYWILQSDRANVVTERTFPLGCIQIFLVKNRHKAQRKAKFYINKCRSASCMQGGLKQASA